MIPVRMTADSTRMFVQYTVPIASTWMAAVVRHTRRSIILRSGRLRNPCWDRKRGHAGGIFVLIPLYANVNCHSLSLLDTEWSEQPTAQAKRHRAPCAGEPSHWRPHAFIWVTTRKPQHGAHRQSRPISPVLQRWCRTPLDWYMKLFHVIFTASHHSA